MPYRQDSWIVSALWGRLGAAALTLVAAGLGALGYAVTPEEQETTFALVSSILAAIGGLLVVISKIREQGKLRE